MGDMWKWASRALIARAAWNWWRARHIREENAAYFLDSKSERELLAGSNNGLVLDGVDARLTADDSFRNLAVVATTGACLLYTSPSPRDGLLSRMPSSA